MYERLIKRASTVVEVLPYLRKFRKKIIVIKYGGSAMIDEEIKDKVMQDMVLLNFVGMYPIIIHGGGKLITQKLEKKKIKSKFIGGVRQTSAEAMQIVAKVLARVNKKIVKQMKYHGGRAIGFSGRKNKLIKSTIFTKSGHDFGFVGEIDNIRKSKISKALKYWKIPVISSIGVGSNNKLYNINADAAASAIASILKAEKLIFMTDVRGVLDKKGDLVSVVTAKKASSMINRKVISGGMIPKVNYGLKALKSGVENVHIIDGRIPRALLLEIFTDSGIGTMIEK